MSVANNVGIDGNALGIRVTAALVVIGLVLEVLSDNFQGWNQGTPMTIEDCRAMCAEQGDAIARVEAFACQCRANNVEK